MCVLDKKEEDILVCVPKDGKPPSKKRRQAHAHLLHIRFLSVILDPPLAVPIERTFPVHHRAAVSPDALALGVQPDLTGADGVVAVICHM